MTDPLRCPQCRKAVADEHALYQHVRAKHGAAARKIFRPIEHEKSVASELVEAIQSGERPAHLVAMFPEAFHG